MIIKKNVVFKLMVDEQKRTGLNTATVAHIFPEVHLLYLGA